MKFINYSSSDTRTNSDPENNEDREFRELVEELNDDNKPMIKLEIEKFMGVESKIYFIFDNLRHSFT